MAYEPQIKYSKILFCTDFSENSDFAFDYALYAARSCADSELFVLHVVPESQSQFWKTYIYEIENVDDKARADIDARIKESYLVKVPEGMKIDIEFRIGKENEEILDFAKEIGADLIVIGRHNSSVFESAFFGNITEKIVRKAHCPILVVPSPFAHK
ncbi:Universal stress protein G [Limihaloglobus sulfuriphilus]|uniref:Universal stress protein G n=1 Tax=Limihaloglobus sulfuriphilus TaxID=1851148 RepID=A0A1Q2MDN0_9BACT|nr:universal stress protein [Limihaloglobus sulfuriphilus]AQQ70813.1 Universal stress protein G [Limihaloglobus sulfuriphilus]